MTEPTKMDKFLAELDKPITPMAGPTGNQKGGKKLGYVRIPGVISTSYSRLQSLHSCPRKFLLRELHQARAEYESVHLAYGSAFGAGIQELLATHSLEKAFLAAFVHWDYSSFDSGNVRNKSLWDCLWALEMFYHRMLPQLGDWELFYLEMPDGTMKPGVELLFYITIGDKYDYQGHIDLMLRHKEDGGIGVWEIKTSGMQQYEAMWGNSDQTNGYHVVMQYVAKKMGLPMHTRVNYLTHTVGRQTDAEKNFGFDFFPYEKADSAVQEFLANILTDVEVLEVYQRNGHFPKRGNSCHTYGRACEFYGSCDAEYMLNPEMGSAANYESLSLEDVDILVDMRELVEAEPTAPDAAGGVS